MDPALRSFCFRLEIKKSGPLLFLVLKYVTPIDPTLETPNIYIYTIYVSEKKGLGVGGGDNVHQTVKHKCLSVTEQNDLKTCPNDAHAQ